MESQSTRGASDRENQSVETSSVGAKTETGAASAQKKSSEENIGSHSTAKDSELESARTKVSEQNGMAVAQTGDGSAPQDKSELEQELDDADIADEDLIDELDDDDDHDDHDDHDDLDEADEDSDDLSDVGFIPEDDSVPSEFDPFVASLAASGADVRDLEGPATEAEIAAAERRMGLSFPDEFRLFLSTWNGGVVHDVSIYGVGSGDEYDIVDYNKRLHSGSLPKEYIAFASTVLGEVFVFPRDWETDQVPVMAFLEDSGRVTDVAPSFVDWLTILPSLGSDEAVEEDVQPQPMTVDEWESFVTREREKLRKLSTTPARELDIPDPEAIRSELKNKIPVDPRHLRKGG